MIATVFPRDLRDGDVAVITAWRAVHDYCGEVVQRVGNDLVTIGSDAKWPEIYPDICAGWTTEELIVLMRSGSGPTFARGLGRGVCLDEIAHGQMYSISWPEGDIHHGVSYAAFKADSGHHQLMAIDKEISDGWFRDYGRICDCNLYVPGQEVVLCQCQI